MKTIMLKDQELKIKFSVITPENIQKHGPATAMAETNVMLNACHVQMANQIQNGGFFSPLCMMMSLVIYVIFCGYQSYTKLFPETY